jgi:hypothetical protein
MDGKEFDGTFKGRIIFAKSKVIEKDENGKDVVKYV